MCTLALYFHVFPQYPIVVAANRDEFLARPSSPPTQLWSAPWVYGGRDLLAGGTWLGINENGVVAGVLNRQASSPPDPQRRSRGLLCLDALQCPSAIAALQLVVTQPAMQYNPLNLLIADSSTAYVVSTGNGAFAVHHLTPGVHLLTNRDPNDPDCPRIAYTSQRFLQVSRNLVTKPTPVTSIFTQLHTILSDHDAPREPYQGLCIHLDEYGTRSSTLLAYAKSEHRYIYHFAPGPPCRTVYEEVSAPSGALASHPPSTR